MKLTVSKSDLPAREADALNYETSPGTPLGIFMDWNIANFRSHEDVFHDFWDRFTLNIYLKALVRALGRVSEKNRLLRRL